MSSGNTPSNYHFHKESTSNALREHLRAFEYAKMQRIVRANADTPASAGIRRKSSSQRDETSDKTPLVPKKAHWTTEERWASETGEVENRGHRQSTTVVTQEGVGEATGKENSGKKSSVGSRIGAEAFKAATGYVEKKDKYGMYPI
jgi:hypothetical protein